MRFLWDIFPYICLSSFVLGHVWRYKYDKFGWTSRSSQWYESRLIRWASPLFHFGILGALAGHVIGLLIPKSWIDFIGVPEEVYHKVAVTAGTLAGFAVVIGMAGLIYRRRLTPAVFKVTTRMDKAMYALLGSVVFFGMYNTVGVQLLGAGFEYRSTVSIWFRSIFAFAPEGTLMLDVPISFKIHALLAFSLLALWPFTRLVHVLSAPIGYIFRPYIVYRSRGENSGGGNRPIKRGWEKVVEIKK